MLLTWIAVGLRNSRLLSGGRLVLAIALTVLAWLQANESSAGAEQALPNVLVILADDLGWSDIGAFGSEIRTPNIDELAAQGIVFTQFYNTARCCPTRASL